MRTVLAPFHAAICSTNPAVIRSRTLSGPSKMPQPSMQAYSAPELLKPSRRTGAPSCSHTADHRDLSRFSGRRVLVVGGGQSALESAALLHEAGADAEVA